MLGMRWEKADAWETRYQLARRYYEEHGNLSVPGDYVEEGVWLGKWVNEQKQIRQGNRPGKNLSAEQTARLEEIGMTWLSKSEETWEERYAHARRFFQEHGHLRVPGGYVSGDGKRLDLWLRLQKQAWRNDRLTARRAELLEEIGMELQEGSGQSRRQSGDGTARTIA